MKSRREKCSFANYTAQGYPKLHSKVGDEGLLKIQQHDRASAKILTRLQQKVTYVGYSELKSNPPETIASFVRCRNGEVFYVINGELQK